MRSVEELLQKTVEKGEIAGANLLVRKDGRELLYAQAGYRDVENAVPYQRDTIARLYSMSKPVTACAVMLLMERGELSLGQSVEEFLPGFRNQMVWTKDGKVPAARPVNVHDLLSMTSGLCYGEQGHPAGEEAQRVFDEVDERLYSGHAMTTEEIANRLGGCGLAFMPGSGWKYGTSADILGAIVEKVSGKRFGDFLSEELFEPLGMKDTGFWVPDAKQHRLAKVYEKSPEGMRECQTNHLGIRYRQEISPAFESGGAGLVSTLDDYARFAQMLLDGGVCQDRRILASQTVEFFTKGRLLPWQQDMMWRTWDSLSGYTYANLMRRSVEPGMAYFATTEGEYGWDGWLGCYFCNIPSQNVTILMTCQRTNAGTMDVTMRLRNMIAKKVGE